MNRVEKIEGQVKELSAQELARFRAWFAEYDWNVWDGELERDVEFGKLHGLASEALADLAAARKLFNDMAVTDVFGVGATTESDDDVEGNS